MKFKNLFIYLSVITATLGATSVQAAMLSKPKVICTATQLCNELASACQLSQTNQSDALYIKLINDCITANAEKDGTISTCNIQAIALSLILEDVKTKNAHMSAFFKRVTALIYKKYFPDMKKCDICKKNRPICVQLSCDHALCFRHLDILAIAVKLGGECPLRDCTAQMPPCLKNVLNQFAEEKDKQNLNRLAGLLMFLNLLFID